MILDGHSQHHGPCCDSCPAKRVQEPPCPCPGHPGVIQPCAGRKQEGGSWEDVAQRAELCASENGCRAGEATVNQGLALLQPLASISSAGSRLRLGRGELGKDQPLRLLCGWFQSGGSSPPPPSAHPAPFPGSSPGLPALGTSCQRWEKPDRSRQQGREPWPSILTGFVVSLQATGMIPALLQEGARPPRRALPLVLNAAAPGELS